MQSVKPGAPEAWGTRACFYFPPTLAAPGSLVHCFLISSHRPSCSHHPFPHHCPDSGLCLWTVHKVSSWDTTKLPLPSESRDQGRSQACLALQVRQGGAKSSQTGGMLPSANTEGPEGSIRLEEWGGTTEVPAGRRGTCACSPGHGSTSCFPSLS